MLDGKKALSLANEYTKETVEGVGAIEGKPCQIQSITEITGGHRVTYLWVDNDGNSHTSTMDVMNGLNGADGAKGDKGDTGERGEIGPQGEQGPQGIQGIQGPKGDTGATGAQGIQGIQGIQGPKGDDGYPFLIYKQYDDISDFNGADFPEIGLMFMVMQEDFDPETSESIGYPIYRYVGTGNPPYSLVVHLASQGIKGDKGDKGDTGAQGIQGEKGDKGDKGDTGEQGAQGVQGPQGVGVPEGGTTGQVLIKNTNADYDIGFKGTTDTVRPGSHDLVESNAVASAINQALASVYTPRGDLTCAELTADLLIEANVGNVYEMSDAGTTSALFVQGAGISISIGDNVGIIKAGANTYMFNYMGNSFDLHDYQKKDLTTPLTIGGTSQTTVEGALGGLNTIIRQKYGKGFGSAHSRYVKIGELEVSAGGGSKRVAFDLTLYTNKGIGQVHLNLEARYGAITVVGQTDIQLTDTNVSAPRIVIAKDDTDGVYNIYVDSDYTYLDIALYVSSTATSFTVGDFSASASLDGTEVFNSSASADALKIAYSQTTSSVTSDSTAPITSGGVYDAMYANQEYGKMNLYALGKTNVSSGANFTYTIPRYCAFLLTTAGQYGTEVSVMAGVMYGSGNFAINAIAGVHTQTTFKIEGGVTDNNKGYLKVTNTASTTRSVNVILLTTWLE